nr:GGDEF domain-containing protein [Ammoniphilus resinae]
MYLAFHDSLTGLKNRAAFDELLASILQENKGNTALLLIDLDNFKLVNDRLGHKTGDELLKAVAYRMKSIVRKEDILFRWGGDEFAIVMPITSKAEAEQVAKGIIENLQDLCTQRDLQFDGEKISVSMGIAIAPVDGVDPESFHRHADQALYRSKEKGKNQYQFYNWD